MLRHAKSIKVEAAGSSKISFCGGKKAALAYGAENERLQGLINLPGLAEVAELDALKDQSRQDLTQFQARWPLFSDPFMVDGVRVVGPKKLVTMLKRSAEPVIDVSTVAETVDRRFVRA